MTSHDSNMDNEETSFEYSSRLDDPLKTNKHGGHQDSPDKNMERSTSLIESAASHDISELTNQDYSILEWDDYLLKADETLKKHDVTNLYRSRLLVFEWII